MPEDSSAVINIKLKEDFYILEMNSFKVSKSYDKIVVAIFDTSIVNYFGVGRGEGGGIR